MAGCSEFVKPQTGARAVTKHGEVLTTGVPYKALFRLLLLLLLLLIIIIIIIIIIVIVITF